MKYTYAYNEVTAGEFQIAINELGSVGWKVIWIEYDTASNKFRFVVEQQQ